MINQISNKEMFLRLGWLPPSYYNEVPEVFESSNQIFTFNHFQDLMTEKIKEIPSDRIALLLSGGIDSAFTGLCAKKAEKEVIAYTVSYEGIGGEENPASESAKLLGIQHKTIRVTAQDCLDIFEEYIDSHEKIHAEWSGLPLALLMKKVKLDGIDHALLGDGGDDLFGGYSFFRLLFDFEKRLHERCLKPMNRALAFYCISRDYMSPIEYSNITGEIASIDFEITMIKYVMECFEGNSLIQGLSDYDVDNWLNQAMIPKVEAAASMSGITAHAPMLCSEIKAGSRTLKDEHRINKKFIRDGMRKSILTPIMHVPKLGFKPPFPIWLTKEPWKSYFGDKLREYNITKKTLNDFTGALFAFRCLVWNHKQGETK